MTDAKAARDKLSLYLFGIVMVLVLLGLWAGPYYASGRTEQVTVRRLEIAPGRTKDSGRDYMVFADQGVYKSTDDLFLGKFDSADVYSRLEVGKTYTVKVYGWRVPFLSWFPNITRIEP